jgi:hypothetical protein
MEGRLAGDVIGSPLSNIRLYSFRDGSFKPILFQIDEMTEDGDWILPDGPTPNKELSNGKLDTWDKIVFMADDSGDRVSKDAWVSGYNKGVEIEITDPLTKEKAWCYLLSFASSVPAKSSQPDYIHYDYATETFTSDYWGAEYIITDAGLHTTWYKKHWTPKSSGGNGENYIDRAKCRVTFKALFGTVPIRLNEEQLESDVLAYRVGPVRLNKRSEQYARIPGGFKALRVVADCMYYRNAVTVPLAINAPFNMNVFLSSAVIRFGTDHSEGAIGSMLYNSCNPKGALIDGKMGEAEKNWNPEFDKWRLLTGDFGTFMTRTILTPEIKENVTISMGLIDDVNQALPPEAYPGSIGFLWQDWDISKAHKGKYYMFIEFYFLPNYKSGDEVQYINYMDNVVKVRTGNQEGDSQALLLSNLGKKYKSIRIKKKK